MDNCQDPGCLGLKAWYRIDDYCRGHADCEECRSLKRRFGPYHYCPVHMPPQPDRVQKPQVKAENHEDSK